MLLNARVQEPNFDLEVNVFVSKDFKDVIENLKSNYESSISLR